MIPVAVSSFRSRHDTRVTATALQFTPRHPRLLPGPTYGAPLFPLAIRCRLFRSPGGSKLLNSPSVFSSVSLLGTVFHASTCMRAHARLRERRVGALVCVRARVRVCVYHSVSYSFAPGARVYSILAPLRVLHQEVVSVQQAGTPRTCLSLSAMFRPSNPP